MRSRPTARHNLHINLPISSPDSLAAMFLNLIIETTSDEAMA